MSLLTVKNLALGYDSHTIVDNINFAVDAGDYLCVVGENGSGKTTLMKTLLGLTGPMGGEIIAGEGFNKKEIGYLPQQTLIQRDFPAAVREIVLSGCLSSMGKRCFYNASDKAIAAKNMEKMGITHLADRSYRDLSGGQQQRVLLARALCAAGRMLLMDEPVSGLDPKVTLEMYELIDNLNKEGMTVVMISHDISAAVKYANKILHIGGNVFFGSVDEFLASEAGKFLSGESVDKR